MNETLMLKAKRNVKILMSLSAFSKKRERSRWRTFALMRLAELVFISVSLPTFATYPPSCGRGRIQVSNPTLGERRCHRGC